MNRATRLHTEPGFTGDAARYRLDPPLADGTSEVVVSAVTAAWTGPETLVFPVINGDVDMLEIGGGRGYRSHVKALDSLGYTVAS